MDFSTEWVAFQIEEYTTASTIYQSDFTVEFLAQLRSSGWVLDGLRFAVDGVAPFDVVVEVTTIFTPGGLPGLEALAVLSQGYCHQTKHGYFYLGQHHRLRSQPGLRHHSGAGVPAGHFIRSIADMPDTGPTNASTRWAIVIAEDATSNSSGRLSSWTERLCLTGAKLNQNFETYASPILCELLQILTYQLGCCLLTGLKLTKPFNKVVRAYQLRYLWPSDWMVLSSYFAVRLLINLITQNKIIPGQSISAQMVWPTDNLFCEGYQRWNLN